MTGFFARVRRTYGDEVARGMKDYTILNKKLAHQTNRRIFLLACRSRGVHPKFLTNGTKNLPTLTQNMDAVDGRRLDNLTKEVRDKLLTLEVRSCCKTVNMYKSQISSIVNCLSQVLDPVLLSDIISLQKRT